MIETPAPFPFIERLPQFLESLEESGIVLDPDQHVRLIGFVAQLAAESRLPRDVDALSRLITPLLAANPAQQETCKELFRSWFGEHFKPRFSAKPYDNVTSDDTETNRRGWWRHHVSSRIALGVTILMVIVTVIIGTRFVDLSNMRDNERNTPRPASAPISPQAILIEWLEKYPIKELDPPEQSVRNRSVRWYYTEYNAAKTAAALLPWALFLSGMGWLVYLMVMQLRREALRKNLNFINWHVDHVRGRFGDRLLLSELQPLRLVARGWTKILDTGKTVMASAQSAGLLRPRFSERPIPCEFVALIDRRSGRDHLAEHNRQVVRVLQDAGIYVEVFEFDREPTLCRSVRSGAYSNLREVLNRFVDSVVLVFIDIDCLIDPATGRTMRWVASFRDGPRCFLLTPLGDADSPTVAGRRDVIPWMRRVPISPQGLVRLVQCFTSRPQPTSKAPISEVQPGPQALIDYLRERPDRWLQRTRPNGKDLRRLLDLLRHAFGDKDYQWIAASAFYPELLWTLTVALKSALKDGKGKFIYDGHLLAAVQLPWFRQGWMPDWFRSALEDTLSPAQVSDIRRVLLGAIEMSTSGRSAGEILKIDLEGGVARGGNRLKVDRIFLEFILPSLYSSRRLFTLPARWAREIARRPVRKLANIAVLGAIASLVGTVVILSLLPIDDCDLYASSRFDNLRVGPPLAFSLVRRSLSERAEAACKKAIEHSPENARFRYQYARVLSAKDPIVAFRYGSQAAMAGYPAAFNFVGDAYLFGIGTPRDFGMAEESYLKAVALGNKASYASLAGMYTMRDYPNNDLHKAFEFTSLASEQGSVDTFELAYYYYEGTVVKKDLAKYIELLQLGVSRRDPESALYLAHEYYLGENVAPSPERNHELMTLAVQWGAGPVAMYNLGVHFADGVGTPKDLEKATYWYAFSAKLGFNLGFEALARHFYEGSAKFAEGHAPPIAPLDLLRTIAEAGSARTQYYLASKLEDDEKKKEEAIIWYQRAAAQNYEDAKRALKRLGVQE